MMASFVDVLQTPRGHEQAIEAGHKIRAMLEADGKPYKLYFYMRYFQTSSAQAPLSMHYCAATCNLHIGATNASQH